MGNPFSTAHPPKAIGGAARKSARDDATQRRIAKDKKRKHSPDPIEEAYGDLGVLEPTAKAARFDPGGQVCPSSFAIPLLFMLFCGTNFVITASIAMQVTYLFNSASGRRPSGRRRRTPTEIR